MATQNTAVKSKCSVRDLSEISRGEGGWKHGEGLNFLRQQKREGQEKMGCKKEGGSWKFKQVVIS